MRQTPALHTMYVLTALIVTRLSSQSQVNYFFISLAINKILNCKLQTKYF